MSPCSTTKTTRPDPRLRVTVIYASSLSDMNRHLAELGFYVGGTSLLLLLLASGLAPGACGGGSEPLRELAAAGQHHFRVELELPSARGGHGGHRTWRR